VGYGWALERYAQLCDAFNRFRCWRGIMMRWRAHSMDPIGWCNHKGTAVQPTPLTVAPCLGVQLPAQ
jgi:hypothetical protein